MSHLELFYGLQSLFLLTLATVVGLLIGAELIKRGVLTIGSYVAFFALMRSLFEQCTGLLDRSLKIQQISGSVGRLLELERLNHVGRSSGELRTSSSVELRVEDLSYHQLSAERALLSGITFNLIKGDRLAVVGPSGSGKTTLLRLVTRQHDVRDGKIFVDGHSFTDASLYEMRKHISLVPQSIQLFAGSLRLNATIGCSRHLPDLQLERMAERLDLIKVVDRFPERWDHCLGPGGSGLSGGEAQRFGILRALLRGSTFLFVDEGTSALDINTERKVLEALKWFSLNHGVLFVSHRSATTQWASKVLEIEDPLLRKDAK